MPVSFKPGDSRERKKEAQEPKIPKTVDEQVKEIADKYYAEQKKRKHVDNWGQPLHKLDEEKIRRELEKARQEARTKFDEGKGKSIPGRLSDAMGRSPSSNGSSDAKGPSEKSEPKEDKERSSQRERRAAASREKPQHGQERAAYDEGSDTKRKAQPDTKSEKTANDIAERFRDEQRTKRAQDDGKKSSLKERFAGLIQSSADTRTEMTAKDSHREASKLHRGKQPEEHQDGALSSTRDVRTSPHETRKEPEPGHETRTARFVRAPDDGSQPDLKQNREKDSRPKENEGRDERSRQYEVKMYTPQIRGQTLETKARLREYINAELPGMKHLPDFEKLMSDAEKQIDLKTSLKGIGKLSFPEIRKYAEQFDIPLRTARKWIQDEGVPKIYALAEKAITRTEARDIIRGIRESNNGVGSIADVEARLSNYYFGEDVKHSVRYSHDYEMSVRYFKYLELLSEGGVQADIARRAGINRLTGVNWTEGIVPKLIGQAREIPRVQPRSGYLWLPTRIEKSGYRSECIEVPRKVSSWNDVEIVLNQLKSKEDSHTQAWANRFGHINKDEAFMHLLGVIVSDGNLSVAHSTARMTLPLSKKYDWSPDLGYATCYHLRKLGVEAKRVSDWQAPKNEIHEKGKTRVIDGPGFYVWESKHVPIQTWIRRSCLGLADNENKINTAIKSEWVLDASKALKVAFLQGIGDGDGYVSVNSQEIALSSIRNQSFYQRVLKSIGIESVTDPTRTLVKQSESIVKVGEVGLFRYAESRKKALDELTSIVKARKSKPASSRLSKSEISYACELRKQGLSYGAITRSIFHEFGRSWDIGTIEHAIKRSKENSKE